MHYFCACVICIINCNLWFVDTHSVLITCSVVDIIDWGAQNSLKISSRWWRQMADGQWFVLARHKNRICWCVDCMRCKLPVTWQAYEYKTRLVAICAPIATRLVDAADFATGLNLWRAAILKRYIQLPVWSVVSGEQFILSRPNFPVLQRANGAALIETARKPSYPSHVCDRMK